MQRNQVTFGILLQQPQFSVSCILWLHLFREKYENLVEDNYTVEETRRVGVMQMSRVSSYSDCECDQQMQVSMQVGTRNLTRNPYSTPPPPHPPPLSYTFNSFDISPNPNPKRNTSNQREKINLNTTSDLLNSETSLFSNPDDCILNVIAVKIPAFYLLESRTSQYHFFYSKMLH